MGVLPVDEQGAGEAKRNLRDTAEALHVAPQYRGVEGEGSDMAEWDSSRFGHDAAAGLGHLPRVIVFLVTGQLLHDGLRQ
jgi:hypothetical protein